jgi:glycerophosphoryl diester phosphodiesterase
MQKILFLFLINSIAIACFGQSEINIADKKSNPEPAQPIVVGHRGGFDSSLPENSIALFNFTNENACSKPIGIEFDIRESASGSLFIMHDSTVDRTTNGNGKIALLEDSYLKTLFLRDRNGNLTNEKIPMFSEVLQHFKDKNIMLMLDVKGKIYPKVIEMVAEMKMESKCILLTFSQNNTKLVKELTGAILISALIVNKAGWQSILKLQIPGQQLIAYVTKETPQDVISEIYRNNVLVMTDMSESINNNSKYYEPEYYKNILTKMQLGIIITDYPVFMNKLFCGE